MYSKIVLDALVEKATDKEISRMIVIINEFSPYRDYADLHKHDPKWWEDLGNSIYTSSPYPKMALAPYVIAASQYLLENTENVLEEKVMPLVTKAMVIDENDGSVQTLAKVTMAVKMGALEPPSVKEMRETVIPMLKKAVAKLDEKLSRE